MRYTDWAAMGAASGAYGAAASAQAEVANAYAEASRARAEVAALREENKRLRDDLDSLKYEREFQKWAEELIYQFAKTVKAITDTPGEPVNDFIDPASFLSLIEAKVLDNYTWNQDSDTKVDIKHGTPNTSPLESQEIDRTYWNATAPRLFRLGWSYEEIGGGVIGLGRTVSLK